MSALLDILGWVALIAGAFFCIAGALGLNRMPDVFTRMHAASVIDTLGVGFLTLGMLAQAPDWSVAVRLGIILVVLWTTGAVASHALARAALHAGVEPILADETGKLRQMPCEAVDPQLAQRIKSALADAAEDGNGARDPSSEREVEPSKS